jgi:hypothetical protein
LTITAGAGSTSVTVEQDSHLDVVVQVSPSAQVTITAPAHGIAARSPDKTAIDYTPTAGFHGQDRFTYTDAATGVPADKVDEIAALFIKVAANMRQYQDSLDK